MVDMNHNRLINVERITNLLANAQNNFADANLSVRAKCAPWDAAYDVVFCCAMAATGSQTGTLKIGAAIGSRYYANRGHSRRANLGRRSDHSLSLARSSQYRTVTTISRGIACEL